MPVVADFYFLLYPSVLSPYGVVPTGRALFARVSLGRPGNWSLGLPHVPSELRGVGFSQFSVLVTNVPPCVSFSSSRSCTGGRYYFRVRLRVTF